MESAKTLREVCTAFGVSRRAVQGYEKVGLVAATGKNKYGHLLYDEKTQKRIEQIKLYQEFGFRVREIVVLIDAPDTEVRAALEKQVLKLEADSQKTIALIEKAYELIDAFSAETSTYLRMEER